MLDVEGIQVNYAKQTVLTALSFQVPQGEIISLLGSSGCGKTTALRAIAGFEPLSAGSIRINTQCVADAHHCQPPEQRNIGMVFQDYALFPHLTVQANIAFGLRKQSKQQQTERVEQLLAAIGLTAHQKRYPHELSGGQQQRVALARALAPSPALILMDEPFSNLDVELRERLSLDVRDILKAEQVTGIMVTHDQHEAFAISDHIGIMQQGKIIQWDTPYNLYHEPQTRYVADFIGQGEFIQGTVQPNGDLTTEFGIFDPKIPHGTPGQQVDILLRPDDLIPDEQGAISAQIVEKAFKGAEIMYTLQSSQQTRLLSLFPSHHNHAIGDWVKVRIDAKHVICFPQTPLN